MMEPADYYPSHVMEPADFYPSPLAGKGYTPSMEEPWKGQNLVYTYYEDSQKLTPQQWQFLLKRARERQQKE